MKNKKLFLLALLIPVSILWISKGFSLEKVTHEYLNQTIAQSETKGVRLDICVFHARLSPWQENLASIFPAPYIM